MDTIQSLISQGQLLGLEGASLSEFVQQEKVRIEKQNERAERAAECEYQKWVMQEKEKQRESEAKEKEKQRESKAQEKEKQRESEVQRRKYELEKQVRESEEKEKKKRTRVREDQAY